MKDDFTINRLQACPEKAIPNVGSMNAEQSATIIFLRYAQRSCPFWQEDGATQKAENIN